MLSTTWPTAPVSVCSTGAEAVTSTTSEVLPRVMEESTRALVDLQRNGLLDEALEARGFDRDAVRARLQVGNEVVAGRIGGHTGGFVGADVGDGDFGVGDDRPGRRLFRPPLCDTTVEV